jgi:hypothetical protein
VLRDSGPGADVVHPSASSPSGLDQGADPIVGNYVTTQLSKPNTKSEIPDMLPGSLPSPSRCAVDPRRSAAGDEEGRPLSQRTIWSTGVVVTRPAFFVLHYDQ